MRSFVIKCHVICDTNKFVNEKKKNNQHNKEKEINKNE